MTAPASLDLDAFMTELQRQFGDGLVTVVGSGLSCAEGLPGMGPLATHLGSEIPKLVSGAEAAQWAELAVDIAAIGLEAALLSKPPSPALESAIVECSATFIAAAERRVVADVFTGTQTLRFTRLLKHLLKPSIGIPVVTTNYDRLIEIAAEEAGLGADTLFVGGFAGALNDTESGMSFCREVTLQGKIVRTRYQDRVIVLKPHGSLDWYHRAGNNDRSFLFTSGFMPELGTYPGPHVPQPFEVRCLGTESPVAAAQDVLNLTRMNWNTADIRGKWPVSLSFARRVGGILDEYGDDALAETSFRYFV